jgi:hypothetical protein
VPGSSQTGIFDYFLKELTSSGLRVSVGFWSKKQAYALARLRNSLKHTLAFAVNEEKMKWLGRQ